MPLLVHGPALVLKRKSASLGVLILVGTLVACSPQRFLVDKPNAVIVGALLPFTGAFSAAGSTIERALMLAAEHANDAGGIGGRPVAILALDTHSDMNEGLDAARALLQDTRVLGLVGPENENLARQLIPLIKGELVQICADVTSPSFGEIDDDGFWFRTNASAAQHAVPLAQRIHDDGVQRAAIVHLTDEYGTGFAPALFSALLERGVEVAGPFSFSPGKSDYSGLVRDVLASEVDGVALIAHPESGATIVGDASVYGVRPRWYLAPSLRSQVFIDNVAPGALKGAVGVDMARPTWAGPFASAFSHRWNGEEPPVIAYRYYDAARIIVLAIAAAAQRGALPTRREVRDHIAQVAGPPGISVGWADGERARAAIDRGEDIDYLGVSSNVDFSETGDLVDVRMEFWSIEDGRL